MSISKHPLYNTWRTMINRCHNKSYPSYCNYGARGIKVCDKWRYNFYQFILDMGERPSDKHQINRIDNNGDYTSDNCEWTTRKRNTLNRRSNKFITYKGETLTHSEWAARLGLHRSAIGVRLRKGWTEEEAVSTPKNYNKDRTYNPFQDENS